MGSTEGKLINHALSSLSTNENLSCIFMLTMKAFGTQNKKNKWKKLIRIRWPMTNEVLCQLCDVQAKSSIHALRHCKWVLEVGNFLWDGVMPPFFWTMVYLEMDWAFETSRARSLYPLLCLTVPIEKIHTKKWIVLIFLTHFTLRFISFLLELSTTRENLYSKVIGFHIVTLAFRDRSS